MTWPEVTGVSSAIQAHTAAPSPPNPDITNHTSWASAPRFTAIFSILILTSWIMMIHRIDELLYKSSKLLRYKRQMLYFEFTSSGTGVYPSSVLVDSLKTQYFVNVSDPSKRPWQHYVGCRSFRFRSLIATHSYCGIKPQIVPYRSASSLWEFSFRDMSYIIYLYGETLQHNLQKNSWIRIKLIWLLSQKKTPVQLPTCHQLCHFPPRICVSKGICVSMGGRPGTPALQGCLETGTMSELSHHFCSPAHGSKALYPTSMEIRVSFFWVCLQLLTIGFIQLIHLTLNGLADVERSDKPKTK